MINTYNETEVQSELIEKQKAKLEGAVTTLKISDEKTIEEWKKVSLELEKNKKMFEIKSKSDKASLRLRIGQLETSDVRNAEMRKKAKEMGLISREMLVESGNTVEKLKKIQNDRMSAMMDIIEQNVQKTEKMKQEALNMRSMNSLRTPNNALTKRRKSSISALLENYDPRIKEFLKNSLQPGNSKASGSARKEKSEERREEEEDDNSYITKQREFKGFSSNVEIDAGQFEDDEEDGFEDIDSQHIKTVRPSDNQYPRKGEDYMSGKTKGHK